MPYPPEVRDRRYESHRDAHSAALEILEDIMVEDSSAGWYGDPVAHSEVIELLAPFNVVEVDDGVFEAVQPDLRHVRTRNRRVYGESREPELELDARALRRVLSE